MYSRQMWYVTCVCTIMCVLLEKNENSILEPNLTFETTV